jgi:hypothetical protein
MTPPRWVARAALPQRPALREIRVTIDADPDTRDGWRSYGGRRLRVVLERWNSVDLPVRLVAARSPREADISVYVIPAFPREAGSEGSERYRAGLTRLTYQGNREIVKATILVAETTPMGHRYSVTDQMATLMHEVGHALGLPHVANPTALMATRTRASGVTAVDVNLARSVYGPTGCPSVQLAAGDDIPGQP